MNTSDSHLGTGGASEAALKREVARSFDCLTEEEVMALAGVKRTTLEARRKRRQAPAYILVGNNYLYPREAVADWLRSQVRQPRDVCGSAAL